MRRWVVALFGVLPWIALAAHGVHPGGTLERLLDGWFSLHCHQDPQRTFAILGQRLPVCARCTGLYLGLFAGAWGSRQLGSARLWLGMLGVGLAVLLLDVGTQAAGLWASSNAVRLLTGFGLAYPAARLAAAAERDPSTAFTRISPT